MSNRTRPAACCPARPPRALGTRVRERLCGAFRALGDPTRLEIFQLICAQPGPVCACDIVDHFDLSQPTISHHLRVLREAGLLRASKAGIWAVYEPEDAGVALLETAPQLLSS